MKTRRFALAILALLLLLIAAVFIAGSILTAPAHRSVGDPPAELNARKVQFRSQSGATIHGWFVPGKKGAGAIILMHGVRSNRLSMLDRARFLHHAGFSVLEVLQPLTPNIQSGFTEPLDQLTLPLWSKETTKPNAKLSLNLEINAFGVIALKSKLHHYLGDR